MNTFQIQDGNCFLRCECDDLLFLRDTFRMTFFSENGEKKLCGIEIKCNGETLAKQEITLAHTEFLDYSELLRNCFKPLPISVADYCGGFYPVLNYFYTSNLYIPNGDDNASLVVTFFCGETSVDIEVYRAIDTHSPKWYKYNNDVYDVECGVWPLDIWDRYGYIGIVGDIGWKSGDYWCSFENCKKTLTPFYSGTHQYCIWDYDTAAAQFCEAENPKSHVGTITITGVEPQKEECGGSQKNKVPMAQVMYAQMDGLTIERWAEVVEESINTNKERETETLMLLSEFDQSCITPDGGTRIDSAYTNQYYTSTRNIFSRKIKLAWRKFPAQERKNIAVGIAQTPVVLIHYKDEILAAKLNNSEDFTFGNDGDLEMEFFVQNIEINRCIGTCEHWDNIQEQ